MIRNGVFLLKKLNFSNKKKCFNIFNPLFLGLIIICLFSCKSLPNGTKVKAVDLLDNDNNFYISIPNAVDPDLIKYIIKNNVKDLSEKDVQQLADKVHRAYIGIDTDNKNPRIQLAIDTEIPLNLVSKVLNKKNGWQSAEFQIENSGNSYKIYSQNAMTISFPNNNIACFGRNVKSMLTKYDTISSIPEEQSYDVSYSELDDNVLEYLTRSDSEINFIAKAPDKFLLMLTGQKLNLQLNYVKGSFIVDPKNNDQYILDFYFGFKNSKYLKAGKTLLTLAFGLTDSKSDSENPNELYVSGIKISKKQLYDILTI